MKVLTLLFSGMTLCLPASGDEPKPPAGKENPPGRKTPVIKVIARLDDCPKAVREALQKNGHDKQISEIKLIVLEGVKSYTFEAGSEEGGKDDEVNYHYSPDGVLLKTEKDIPLKEAPAAVRDALRTAAGTTAVIDDVEIVTEGKQVSYKAELESNGGTDRKIRVSSTGEVLEIAEESDD